MIQPTLKGAEQMLSIYVKLRQREKGNKYRKILSTECPVYQTFAQIVTSSSLYSAGAVLEVGEWFYVSKVSQQSYALDIFALNFDSVDFDLMEKKDFTKIDFLFTVLDNDLFFQNIPKTRLVSKKHIFCFGEDFKYQNDCNDIVINELPDAIYHKETDKLYFRRLESITGIFNGIDQLYKEATDEETEQFLNSAFVTLAEGYSAANVKTANRKRIALATKTLSKLSEYERKNIFNYIGDYCPELKVSESTFEVGSENELKMLLYGIEQRFYTTPVGAEKRLANSVITLEQS